MNWRKLKVGKNTAKVMLGLALSVCCVGMGSENTYAAYAGNTSYVNTVSSSPEGIEVRTF